MNFNCPQSLDFQSINKFFFLIMETLFFPILIKTLNKYGIMKNGNIKRDSLIV